MAPRNPHADKRAGERKVHDLAAAPIDVAGPQNHPDHCRDVAAAADEADLDVGELTFAEDQRQEDPDAVGADQESELREREDNDAHVADGDRQVPDLPRARLSLQPLADDAALLVVQPCHILETIGKEPQQADTEEHDRQPLDQKQPLPAGDTRRAVQTEQPSRHRPANDGRHREWRP